MSEKIRINNKASKTAVSVTDDALTNFSVQDSTENFIQKQLEQAYQLAFTEGRNKEREELEQIFSQRLLEKYTELNNIMAKLDEKVLLYEKEFENLVVNLSFIIAEAVTRKEIERETTISITLKAAVKKILGANSVIVKLHPQRCNFYG